MGARLEESSEDNELSKSTKDTRLNNYRGTVTRW